VGTTVTDLEGDGFMENSGDMSQNNVVKNYSGPPQKLTAVFVVAIACR
jgi:hypothetical protein